MPKNPPEESKEPKEVEKPKSQVDELPIFVEQGILDMGFGEDKSQSCVGYCGENLAVIRHLGLNLLSRDRSSRVGINFSLD